MTRSWKGLWTIVALVGLLGAWALATIRFQVELLPLFPQHLPTVRGMSLLESVFGSSRELTIVLDHPARELPGPLSSELEKLPEVAAVGVIGVADFDVALRQVGWLLVNQSPQRFAEFQSFLAPASIRERLADTRQQLAGAVSGNEVMRLQLDPLQLLPWLQETMGPALSGSLGDDPPATDGPRIVALAVESREPLTTFWETQRFVDTVRATVTATCPPGTSFYLTGRAAFMAENSRQMENDMWKMLLIAVGLIGAAFWLFYRSWRALAWVICFQALSILAALVVGRLAFGALNVISIGFAAILLGVGMDYFILVYHFFGSAHEEPETQAHWAVLQRGIWLSSITTAAAFGVLTFSSFPGLQQLAVLIGAGLLASAWSATRLFPLILQRQPPRAPHGLNRASENLARGIIRYRRPILGVVALALLGVILARPLTIDYPFYNADVRALRPRHSEAYAGLERLAAGRQAAEGQEIILTAASLPALRAKAAELGDTTPLLPLDDYLAANRQAWQPGQTDQVEATMRAEGFDADWSRGIRGLVQLLDHWQRGENPFAATQLLMSNVAALPDNRGVGALVRAPGNWDEIRSREPSAVPANWDLLTAELARVTRSDFHRLLVGVLLAVVGLCWWAHRSWRLVILNLAVLTLALVGLLALLWLTGQSLTLLSLLAVPLLVGLIIDISLHLVLGMEETGGDLVLTFRHMAAPVVLTGLCTMIGFGAPALSGQPALQNFGMAMDMGIVAAVGAGLVVLPALYLSRARTTHYSATLYRAPWFTIGAWIGQHGGPRLTRALGWLLAWGFHLTHPGTRRILRQNLALLQTSPVTARMPRRTIMNFGRTLADYFLLGTRSRAEALALTSQRIGFEHLEEARQGGQGVILATAHLGLFEYGALWMEHEGWPTTILTLPEPSPSLGRWRAAYRRRWGAETVEVGEDLWSSVEVIRLLKQGRNVALLVDRPYGGHFVPVEFPGGQVPFSTGPVWLSLLSGSPIVAVAVVRTAEGGYRIEAFPPLHPHWLPAGRDETVRQFTVQLGEVLREPICRHPDQWYQFVSLKA